MSGGITYGTGARPPDGDIVFGVEPGAGGGTGALLEMTVPVVPINTVLLAIVVHDDPVFCANAGWDLVDTEGAGAFKFDVYRRQVDAAYLAEIKAGTKVAFLSTVDQELTGGLLRSRYIDPIATIEASVSAPFAADAAPIAPASFAASQDDTVLCGWVGADEIAFTPPAAFTTVDTYTSAVITPTRSLLLAFTTAADIGPAGPVEPGAATAAPAATGRAVTFVLRYLSPGVVHADPKGIATPRGSLGLLDMHIDPVTLDYIDTDDGEWLETADSRTAVMIMIDTQLGKSYSAPGDGTRIVEMLERGDPVTPELVAAEITRALRRLEETTPPMIRDITVRATDKDRRLLVDETGRFSPEIRYTDVATGSPVDLVYSPFAGGAS